MATGTGERPLGTPAQEKSLLGLSTTNTFTFSIAGNTTRYLVFPATGASNGLLFFSGYDTVKHGLYICGRASSGDMKYTAVHAINSTSSGAIITFANHHIKIENKTSYLYGTYITSQGEAPTLSSTAPT